MLLLGLEQMRSSNNEGDRDACLDDDRLLMRPNASRVVERDSRTSNVLYLCAVQFMVNQQRPGGIRI